MTMTRIFCAGAFLMMAGLAGAGELEGKWTSGRISSIQYRDAYTGVSRPPSVNYFAFEFRPDGTYVQSGRHEVSADGTVVTMHPQKNPFRMTNTCSPSSNREGPGKLAERSYRIRITGNKLELVNVNDPSGNLATYHRER